MPITHNPSSGVSLYHYSNKVINDNKIDRMKNKDRALSRHERRIKERRLKKKINNYLNSSK